MKIQKNEMFVRNSELSISPKITSRLIGVEVAAAGV